MPPSRSFMEEADSFLDESFMADAGEIDRVLQETEANKDSTDTKVLQKGLRNAHIALSNAQAESIELRKRFMELKTTVIHLAAMKRKKRRAKDVDDSEDDDDDLIPEGLKEIARYLRMESKKCATIFVFFWSYSTPASLTANPNPMFEWDNVERRFASPDAMRLGLTAELYACIPEKFHDYLRWNKDPFCKLFYTFAGKLRSVTSNRLRTNAAAIFGPMYAPLFDAKRLALANIGTLPTDPKELLKLTFGPHMFKKGFNRDECDILLNQLGYDPTKVVTEATKGQSYSKWPGVIYENGEYDPGKEFLNDLLFRVARVNIYGPSAVDGERSACRIRDGSPMAGEDLETTIGLIVNTALYARWMLSADTELNNNGVGNRTGIDYPADANSYKFALLSLQEKNPEAMQRLLDVWDEKVFPNYAGSRSAEQREAAAVDAPAPNPALPIQSDQEHFARMQAAMARAQIVDSAYAGQPAPAEERENVPSAHQSAVSTSTNIRAQGRSADVGGVQSGRLSNMTEDDFEHHDGPGANSTFLTQGFLESGLGPLQHSTPAPQRRRGTAGRACHESGGAPHAASVSLQASNARARLAGAVNHNESRPHSNSATVTAAATNVALPHNNGGPSSQVSQAPATGVPDLQLLRVSDLKDWCTKCAIRFNSKPTKGDLIALIQSSGQYPTQEHIAGYKAMARTTKVAGRT